MHKFNDCVSASCSCACVREIYLRPKNELVEEVPDDSPKFMKINNVEIKKLPDLAKEVSRLAKIDKHEWIRSKKDRRFKSKRHGDHNA
jgi:hypothetical protein